jgi:mono/diheme cytochrome c family protein
MKYIFSLLLSLPLLATSTFITPMEYASQLYKNPRGVGCQKCHGIDGEGMVIARYKHKNEEKSFIGPQINHLSYQAFYKALNERKKGMPRYYLTRGEIKALYRYLHRKEKEAE